MANSCNGRKVKRVVMMTMMMKRMMTVLAEFIDVSGVADGKNEQHAIPRRLRRTSVGWSFVTVRLHPMQRTALLSQFCLSDR